MFGGRRYGCGCGRSRTEILLIHLIISAGKESCQRSVSRLGTLSCFSVATHTTTEHKTIMLHKQFPITLVENILSDIFSVSIYSQWMLLGSPRTREKIQHISVSHHSRLVCVFPVRSFAFSLSRVSHSLTNCTAGTQPGTAPARHRQ
jgi:hypothetical protein